MSNNLLQTQVQHTPVNEKQDHPTYEVKMFWRIRWYFAIFVSGACLLAAVASIIGFIITKNLYLLGIAPSQSILLAAMFYLVPMDERRYQLRALKIQSKAQIKAQKVQAKAQKQATKQHK